MSAPPSGMFFFKTSDRVASPSETSGAPVIAEADGATCHSSRIRPNASERAAGVLRKPREGSQARAKTIDASIRRGCLSACVGAGTGSFCWLRAAASCARVATARAGPFFSSAAQTTDLDDQLTVITAYAHLEGHNPLPASHRIDTARRLAPTASDEMASAQSLSGPTGRVRSTNRYSALQSLIADQDTEIEDELARGESR